MTQVDWKIYRGFVPSTKDGAKELGSLHTAISPLLENDNRFCPPWRNFRARYEAFMQFHQLTSGPLPTAPDELDTRGEAFRPTEKMIEMVNVALYLRRPLLITGKPGTGKSSLIYSVARELKLGKVLRWPITSRSSLQRGLYEYDAIGRLQDWQLKELRRRQSDLTITPSTSTLPEVEPPSATSPTEAADIGEYLRLGPLGTALQPWAGPRALLIDEIDKCDADLPNDLLNVFEEGHFEIPELVRLRKNQKVVKVRPADSETEVEIVEGRVQCLHFPFVVMTSNGEREFPPAFLRRCVQLEIPPPDKTMLWEIVKSHLGPEVESEATQIIHTFTDNIKNGKKQLSTDQLLNAIFLLSREFSPGFKDREDIINAILKPLNK